MTQTETDEDSMRLGLEKVVELIELASLSVAKLMASVSLIYPLRALRTDSFKDSVPKFLRDPKYQGIIREHQIDMNLAQRALSPAPSPGPANTSIDKSLSRSNTARGTKPQS